MQSIENEVDVSVITDLHDKASFIVKISILNIPSIAFNNVPSCARVAKVGMIATSHDRPQTTYKRYI
jgi:hypothetical protein